ncbi:MFS transporter [Rhizobium laguerreae]|uniref:MFS transporter n=1 Tax=Rhizobium laguerreae TaxID=1076926 RepID=UPI001C924CC2|nr:MFS transporter [Rhizobium laguerreae]MBY3307375.1 MFS transporter [Rhizobium laguerreae]
MTNENDYLPEPGPTALAPLNNAAFRSIWMAMQIADMGWVVQTLAVSWLLTSSSSPRIVALVLASTTLPAFFVSIIAGAIADNFSRRLLMLAGLSVVAIASILTALSVAFDVTNPWLFLGLNFLAGCGFALYEPGWHASVGDIFQEREIQAAVTLISVGYNTSRSVAPALAGAILAFLCPLSALGFAAVTTLAPIGAVWRNSWPARSSILPPERIATSIQNGLRFTALTPDLRAAIIRATLFGLASSSILSLLPVIAQDRAAGDPMVVGILSAGFGTGACLAGTSSRYLRIMLPQELLMTLAAGACAVCCLALAHTSSMILGTVALALGGAGWLITWSGFDGWVQRASPRWVFGRSYSIYYAFLSGGIAVGSWIWGTVAEGLSLNSALIWAAAGLFLLAAAGYLMPAHVVVERDQRYSEFRPPELALNLDPRTGPIISKTEYFIEEADLETFLRYMRIRRHSMSRAGARAWSLQRDLRKPSKWTETFRTPTWTDYLRLNGRLSLADQEVGQLLVALHVGTPPQLELAFERPI